MSTKTPADFYFDPVSPFAFLMWKRLREDDFGLEISPVPVLLGALLNHWGLIGPAEAHVEKLRRLEAAGVTQFNIYLCSGEEERQIAEYGEHVIPHFR